MLYDITPLQLVILCVSLEQPPMQPLSELPGLNITFKNINTKYYIKNIITTSLFLAHVMLLFHVRHVSNKQNYHRKIQTSHAYSAVISVVSTVAMASVNLAPCN